MVRMPLTVFLGSFLPEKKVYFANAYGPPHIDWAYWHIDMTSKSLISRWIDPLHIDDIPTHYPLWCHNEWPLLCHTDWSQFGEYTPVYHIKQAIVCTSVGDILYSTNSLRSVRWYTLVYWLVVRRADNHLGMPVGGCPPQQLVHWPVGVMSHCLVTNQHPFY